MNTQVMYDVRIQTIHTRLIQMLEDQDAVMNTALASELDPALELMARGHMELRAEMNLLVKLTDPSSFTP